MSHCPHEENMHLKGRGNEEEEERGVKEEEEKEERYRVREK